MRRRYAAVASVLVRRRWERQEEEEEEDPPCVDEGPLPLKLVAPRPLEHCGQEAGTHLVSQWFVWEEGAVIFKGRNRERGVEKEKEKERGRERERESWN